MSDITYTRITPNGEEKSSLRNGDGMTIEEKTKAIAEHCKKSGGLCIERVGGNFDCPLYAPEFDGQECYKDYKFVERNYQILVDAGYIKPPVNFTKVEQNDEVIIDGWEIHEENSKDIGRTVYAKPIFNFVKANPDDEIDGEGDAVESGLADSGTRREFASGAVRDVAEGKGRCDLLPLYEVSQFLRDSVLRQIDGFVSNGNPSNIYSAIELFCNLSVISKHEAILEVAKHFEAGCKKYGERNWEKGIPIHCYIDSGVRHYLKHKAGYTDEPHSTAFLWNMLCLLWTLRNKPELNDLPWAKEDNR